MKRGAVVAAAFAALVIATLWTLEGKLHRLAPGVIGVSVVYGCLNAFLALGLVLIYRSSRVINFAQAAFGIVAANLFFELTNYWGVSWWLAFPASLVAAALLGALMELLFIRRFFRAPRLVVAVVTLGIAELLGGLAAKIPALFNDHNSLIDPERPSNQLPRPAHLTTPFSHWHQDWFPVRFYGDHLFVLGVAAVVLVGFAMFFKLTSVGIAVRGSAENDDRANELGVNTRSLSTLVWVIAAVLSALAAVLQIAVTGIAVNIGSGDTVPVISSGLLVALAAAVIGGMESLPITFASAIGLAMMSQLIFYEWSQTAIVDAANLGIIVVALLLQRKKLARTDAAGASSWAATEEVRPIPTELNRLPTVRAGARRFVTVLALFVVAFPFFMSPSQVALGTSTIIDGIVIVSLVILTGWGGQISLGQYAFVAVGALVGGALITKVGLPFGPALLLGAGAGAVIAVVLGLTALRVRGLYLAVATLAFAIVTRTVLLNNTYFDWLIATKVNRPVLLFIHTDDEKSFYFLCLGMLAICWWAAMGLRRTRTGRTLIAARDNERGAQAFGVNLVRTRLVTFALSGFMAASAGVLLAAQQHGVSADAFPADTSVQIFLTAVIGGLGSIQGALLGAVYFAAVNFAVHGAVGRLLASSFGVLIVLMFLPGGLGSLAYRGRDAVLRRVAIRRRIFVPSLLADHAAAAAVGQKAPLAPRPTSAGTPKDVPARYRQKSRIRVAGTSQSGKGWTYG